MRERYVAAMPAMPRHDAADAAIFALFAIAAYVADAHMIFADCHADTLRHAFMPAC